MATFEHFPLGSIWKLIASEECSTPYAIVICHADYSGVPTLVLDRLGKPQEIKLAISVDTFRRVYARTGSKQGSAGFGKGKY